MEKYFEIRKFTFKNNNINLFERYEFSRPLHLSHLKKIRLSLKEDNYLIGNVIIVNEKDNKFYIINGGHRIEAIKQELNDGIKEIKSAILIYKNLSDGEVKEKMRVMGLVDKVQDLDSLLEVYKEDIFIFKKFHQLPVKIGIKRSKHNFKFRDIIYLLQVKDFSKMNYGRRTEDSLDFILNCHEQEFEYLLEFLKYFKEIFGAYSKENLMWKSVFIIAFSSVYGRNKIKVLNNQKINHLFKDDLIDTLIKESTGLREQTQKMRERILKILDIEDIEDEN